MLDRPCRLSGSLQGGDQCHVPRHEPRTQAQRLGQRRDRLLESARRVEGPPLVQVNPRQLRVNLQRLFIEAQGRIEAPLGGQEYAQIDATNHLLGVVIDDHAVALHRLGVLTVQGQQVSQRPAMLVAVWLQLFDETEHGDRLVCALLRYQALAEEARGQRARRLELQEATVELLGHLEPAGVKSA